MVADFPWLRILIALTGKLPPSNLYPGRALLLQIHLQYASHAYLCHHVMAFIDKPYHFGCLPLLSYSALGGTDWEQRYAVHRAVSLCSNRRNREGAANCTFTPAESMSCPPSTRPQPSIWKFSSTRAASRPCLISNSPCAAPGRRPLHACLLGLAEGQGEEEQHRARTSLIAIPVMTDLHAALSSAVAASRHLDSPGSHAKVRAHKADKEIK